MPRSFPTFESLKSAARVHNFREPRPDETEENFRKELADHVATIDPVESTEIRTGLGWDKQREANPFALLHGIISAAKIKQEKDNAENHSDN